MAEPFQLVGGADVTIPLFLQNLSGAGKTGLVAADLTCYYVRRRAAAVQIVLSDLAAVDSVHADGGLIEVDATNMPGHYRLDLPDAVAAAGSPFAAIVVKGAAIVPCNVQLPLWQFNDANMEAMRKELLNDRLYTIVDGKEEVLDDDGETVHETIDAVGSISFTGAAFELATLTLTKAGAFTDLKFKSGDQLTVTGGTGATLGQVEIDSKSSGDAIVLAAAIAAGDVADVAGTIVTGRVLRKRS
jgi:hypothetical protein